MDEVKVFLATDEKQDQIIQKQTEVKTDTTSLITKVNTLQTKVDSIANNPVTSFDYRSYNPLSKQGYYTEVVQGGEKKIPSYVNEFGQSVTVVSGKAIDISGEGFVDLLALATHGASATARFRIIIDEVPTYNFYVNNTNYGILFTVGEKLINIDYSIYVPLPNVGSRIMLPIDAIKIPSVSDTMTYNMNNAYCLLPFPIFFKRSFVVEISTIVINTGIKFMLQGGLKK